MSRAVPVAQWNATRPTEAKKTSNISTRAMVGLGPSNPLPRDSNSQHWTGCAPCLLHLERERPDKSMTLGRLTCAQLSLAPTPPSPHQLEAIQPPKPHRSTHIFRGIRFFSAKMPNMTHLEIKAPHHFPVRTPICQIVPFSRIYTLRRPPKKEQLSMFVARSHRLRARRRITPNFAFLHACPLSVEQ